MDIVHKNGTIQTYNISVVADAISRLDIKQYPVVDRKEKIPMPMDILQRKTKQMISSFELSASKIV